MTQAFRTVVGEAMYRLSASAAGQLPRAVILAVVTAVALLVWMISAAPALDGFAATIAIVIGWCVWLERHPEAGGDGRP